MSINKIYLKNPKELAESLKNQGSDIFYMNFIKGRESFIGSSDSHDFINAFIKKYTSTNSIFNEI